MDYAIVRSLALYDVLRSPSRGIRVHDYREGYRGGRFHFIVWDKQTRRDLSSHFASLREGQTWADNQRGLLVTDQARAGRITLASVIPGYLDNLRGRKATPGHVAEVERTLNAAVAAGVADLKASTVGDKINKMLAGRTVRGSEGGAPLAAHTCYRLASHIKSLGNWLVETGEGFPRSPFRKVALPAKPVLAMEVFTPDEMRIMATRGLEHADGLFFVGLAYAGTRCRELAWMRWSAVLWQAKRLRISLPDDTDREEAARLSALLRNRSEAGRTAKKAPDLSKKVKGSKERMALLMDEFADILKPTARISNEYIFPEWTRRGDRNTINRHLAAFCTHCGVTKGERTVHSLRATNAATLLASGLDVIRLRKHLGHSTLAMSDHYANAGDAMTEQCAGWGGQLRWRAMGRAAAPALSGIYPAKAVSQRQPTSSVARATRASRVTAPDPEGEIIVIDPDDTETYSEIYRAALFGRTGTDDIAYTVHPGLGSCAERREGSSPSVRTSFDNRDLEDDGLNRCDA